MSNINDNNFFQDNPDIAFHLNKPYFQKIFNLLIEYDQITNLSFDEYKKLIIDFLQKLGEISANVIATNSKILDSNFSSDNQYKDLVKQKMQESLESLKNIGAHKVCIPTAYDGMGYPLFVELIASEIVSRACPSTTLNMSGYNLIFHFINQCTNFEKKDEFLHKISSGEISGNIAFTEITSGSDLRTIKTYASFDENQNMWKIFGEKFFITNPEADFCIVLAKIEGQDTQSIKDLNLFLVPKIYNKRLNFEITQTLNTIGFSGTNFGCIKFNGSFAYNLALGNAALNKVINWMNYGRIAVGFQALGIMETCYRKANEYCSTRIAWDRPLIEHELILETLTDIKAQIQAFRSLCYEAAYTYSYIYIAKQYLLSNPKNKAKFIITNDIPKLEKRLKKWIPIIKWWASEKTFLIAQKCLELLGARGYLKEYSLGRFLNDSLALTIYEGAAYNQALIVMKDNIKEFVRSTSKLIGIFFRGSQLTISKNKDLNKKFNRSRTLFYKTLLKLMMQLIRENLQVKISSIDPSDISKALKIITKDIVDFKTISLAIFQSIRLCEMKALICMSYRIVEDTNFETSKTSIAEYFIDKVLLQCDSLSKQILHYNKYLNTVIQDTKSKQDDELWYLKGF